MTVSRRARELHAKHPEWTPTQIAVHLGDKSKRSVVARALQTDGKRTGRPRKDAGTVACEACAGTGRVKG